MKKVILNQVEEKLNTVMVKEEKGLLMEAEQEMEEVDKEQLEEKEKKKSKI